MVTYFGCSEGGVTYIRWGKSECPEIAWTKLVYAGQAAGSDGEATGGGVQYLCLPNDPENEAGLTTLDGVQGMRNYIKGAEYQTSHNDPEFPHFSSLHDQDVPCAVCFAERRTGHLMIPGRTTCYGEWVEEYHGFLMSALHHHQRTGFACVDHEAEGIPDSSANLNGALFFLNEYSCGSLKCPPYETGKEVHCVVCTI